MDMDMDTDKGLIPIGSWDTHRQVPQQSANPSMHGHEQLPFLEADDSDLRDECMTKALHLLDQANILRFQRVQLGDTPDQNHPHHRFLIYGLHQSNHSLGRFGTNARSRQNQERVRTKHALATILINMNTDPWVFQNRMLACPPGHTATTLFQADMDKRLIDIYTEMPSPRAMDDPYTGDNARRPLRSVERLLKQVIEQDAPKGMRTKLYRYQKNSLWKLLRRELCPDFILDPSFIPVQDMEGQPYYLDVTNDGLSICRTPSAVWDDAQGGIICEDMGTGKTCLCIALILQTLHQFSLPPTINTRLHSELYPFVPSQIISLQDGDDYIAAPELMLPAGSQIPSLRDLAATSVKLNGIEYRRAHDFISPTTMSMLEDISVYYYEEETVTRKRTSRTRQATTEDQPPEIYLSNATLVIVPPNLTDQWLNEINKHTEDFALKTLEISPDPAAELPDHKTLMRYDLVLISLSRFAKEYVPGAYSRKRTKEKPPCRCEERYITCRCPPPRSISPLMQVRWKRVIVDEGHSLGMKLSDHSLLAEKLHADRRWICTGTPTFNLANLQPSSGSNTAAASMSDKGDLDRLSALFGSFLHLRPYCHDKDLFSKVIQKPLVEHHNISTGVIGGSHWSLETLSSVSRLRYLMDRVMVRNKAEDVERDVTLPPLYERIVRLDLEYFQVLAINCQIALIQANAVLTERVDQDYFFHPSNRKHLARVVENLKDGCFWYPGGDDYKNQLQSALKHVQRGIQKHRETEGGKYSDQDARLLVEICDHIKRALRDHSWNAIQRTQEVGYYCKGLPQIFQGMFALIPSLELGTVVDDVEDEDEMPTGEQSGASGSAWIPPANPVTLGMPAVGEEDQVCVTLAKQITHLRTEVAKYEQDMNNESANGIDGRHHSLPATAGGWASTSADQDQPMHTQEESSMSEAMVLERLRKARILSSTSSKLNYVISQVLRHHTSEKCIVFCQSRTAMYYIHEYLTLAKVRCRMYHTQGMTERERSNTIMTFNTSEMVSTIIMDTKHAAFGIDLSSASRVYFVSPVWQTATMRQAVKRAHRIGQIRPVYVETLVIRNSFEEAILNRRLELDDATRLQDKKKGMERHVGEDAGDADLETVDSGSGISRASRNMVDDRKMRDLISHIDFMPLPTWTAPSPNPPSSSAYSSLAGGSSTFGGRGIVPLNGASHDQQHLYSTLEDYASLDGGAQDTSLAVFAVPVIFPSKKNGLAARRQPHAADTQDVSAMDQPLALDEQQQTVERQDDDAIQEPQEPQEPQDEQRTVQWSFWQGDTQEPTGAEAPDADSSMELNPDDVEEVYDDNLDYPTQWKEEAAMSEQQSGEVLEGLPTTQLNRMKLEESEVQAKIKVEPDLGLGDDVKRGGRFKAEPDLGMEDDVKRRGLFKAECAPAAIWNGVKEEIKAEEGFVKQEDLRLFPKVEPEHFVLFDHADDRAWKQELEQEVLEQGAVAKAEEEEADLLRLKDEPTSLLATKRSPEGVAGGSTPPVKSESGVKRVRFC